MGNFLANTFRLLPESRMTALQGSMPSARPDDEVKGAVDEYCHAIRDGKQSRGSFINAAGIAEATCLATVAIRTGEHLVWDAANMQCANTDVPHALKTREYRDGWAI